MALNDYANRRYDFLALQNVKPTGDNQLGLLLFENDGTSKICVGVQKLAQRWLLEFLTEVGSMPGLPTRGTPFMTQVRTGRLRTTADVVAAFNSSAYTARVTLNKEEDDTWPDDERLSYARLLGVTFFPGYANIKVAIYSRSGNTRSVILPVATLPQTIK
jgi:hypothetical protein